MVRHGAGCTADIEKALGVAEGCEEYAVMHEFCEAGGLVDLTSWCNGVLGRGGLGGRDSMYSFGRLYSVSVLREDLLRAGVVVWCDWLRKRSGPRGNWNP